MKIICVVNSSKECDKLHSSDTFIFFNTQFQSFAGLNDAFLSTENNYPFELMVG